jgi:two-component system response regulator (stage 0 sporulation protein F)
MIETEKIKILIVENDPVQQRVIESLVANRGYMPISVSSVDEAISTLKLQQPIHLIIASVAMPVRDGFDLLKHLKKDTGLRLVPTIMCSTTGDEKLVSKSIELGASDFIIKPVEPEYLLPKIDKLLDDHHGKLLVVDDEKVVLDLLVKVLQREGYATITATSGEEALGLLESTRLSGVISDIMMPGMNGIELLKSIKQRNQALPVLLITGYAGKVNINNAMEAGADGYISKPFKNIQIIQKLKELGI